MKLIIFLIASLTLSLTSVNAHGSNELFSVSERKDVIQSIDNTCGDSWCEGDYNFKFVDFSCDKSEASCDLSFHFIKSNELSIEIYSPTQVCHFDNIIHFRQIKESKFSLNEKFYNQLTNCISVRENNVQF